MLAVNDLFSEYANGSGEMIEREKAAFKFFATHQKFAKAVKPTVRHFNNPVSGFLDKVAFERGRFLPAPCDMSHVAVRLHEAQCGCSGVACLST